MSVAPASRADPLGSRSPSLLAARGCSRSRLASRRRVLSRPATPSSGCRRLICTPRPSPISSASGATLRGWFVAGRPGGGAVVLMHGVHANRLSMVRRARSPARGGILGAAVRLPGAWRKHRRRASPSAIWKGSMHAPRSPSCAQRLPAERVGAIGSSLGGAAALLGPGPLPVDALVLESRSIPTSARRSPIVCASCSARRWARIAAPADRVAVPALPAAVPRTCVRPTCVRSTAWPR